MAVLPIIAMVVSAAGAIYNGIQSSNAADYNAKVSEQNAEAAQQKARLEENIQRQKIRTLMSKQQALYGASGVDMAGSPLLVMEDTAAKGELDALAIRYSGEIAARQARSQAEQFRQQGDSAMLGGFFKAGSSLLGGYNRSLGGSSSSSSPLSDYGPYESGYKFPEG